MKKIKVIITGATGMVGEGVLHECLINDRVEEILSISRKDCGVKHPKLKQIIITDFFDLSSLNEKLKNYDACFFCLGMSSIGMKDEDYKKLTYDLTINFAQELFKQSPGATFSYVSGTGTDQTEKSKYAWARVKGRTENDLMKIPFKQVFAFRPGYLQPGKGLKNTKKFYNYIKWIYKPIKLFFPGFGTTLKELGQAMINSATDGYDKKIVKISDIIILSKKIY